MSFVGLRMPPLGGKIEPFKIPDLFICIPFAAAGLERHRGAAKVGSPRAATRGITVHSPEGSGSTSGLPGNAVSGPVSPECPSSENKTVPGAAASPDEANSETLNLPAVLWDKPPGSKTRVPPPIPPRSPKRPLDPTGAFATATLEDGFVGRGSVQCTSPVAVLF